MLSLLRWPHLTTPDVANYPWPCEIITLAIFFGATLMMWVIYNDRG
jgi:hypothetical protein